MHNLVENVDKQILHWTGTAVKAMRNFVSAFVVIYNRPDFGHEPSSHDVRIKHCASIE